MLMFPPAEPDWPLPADGVPDPDLLEDPDDPRRRLGRSTGRAAAARPDPADGVPAAPLPWVLPDRLGSPSDWRVLARAELAAAAAALAAWASATAWMAAAALFRLAAASDGVTAREGGGGGG